MRRVKPLFWFSGIGPAAQAGVEGMHCVFVAVVFQALYFPFVSTLVHPCNDPRHPILVLPQEDGTLP